MHRVIGPLLYVGFGVSRAKGVYIILKAGFEEVKVRSQARWAIPRRIFILQAEILFGFIHTSCGLTKLF